MLGKKFVDLIYEYVAQPNDPKFDYLLLIHLSLDGI